MCGRYNLRTNAHELEAFLGVPIALAESLLERFNIAPTQTVVALREVETNREAAALRWGLIPSWSKDEKIGNRLINARSETAADKPSFRAAFKRRRCLIPASGFYEWQGAKGAKQPFHIHPASGGLMAFAGLWEHWEQGDAGPIESCTILTTGANRTLSELHNRMPVILSPSDFEVWLDVATPRDSLVSLLRPAAEDLLDFEPISTQINNVRNEGPECLERM